MYRIGREGLTLGVYGFISWLSRSRGQCVDRHSTQQCCLVTTTRQRLTSNDDVSSSDLTSASGPCVVYNIRSLSSLVSVLGRWLSLATKLQSLVLTLALSLESLVMFLALKASS